MPYQMRQGEHWAPVKIDGFPFLRASAKTANWDRDRISDWLQNWGEKHGLWVSERCVPGIESLASMYMELLETEEIRRGLPIDESSLKERKTCADVSRNLITNIGVVWKSLKILPVTRGALTKGNKKSNEDLYRQPVLRAVK